MKEVAELHIRIHRIGRGADVMGGKRGITGDFYIKDLPSVLGGFMPRGLDRFILS